jgi:lipoprotein-releasing system permease protein
MFKTYLKYFFFFIIKAKNRQRLLILAVVGLFISSFALIVLQSTMGGLQNKLMERSKAVIGHATVFYKSQDGDESGKSIERILSDRKLNYTREYEIELLLRYQTYITPVIVHGIDQKSFLPPFLKNSAKDNRFEAVMPMELAYKVGVAPPETLELISPSHVDSLLGDIPRSQSVQIDRTFSSDVPEIDMYHMWVRLPLIQNLIQNRMINRFRIYSNGDFSALKKSLPTNARLMTWEDENKTLVWALNLESSVMIFLFAAMSLLVSLCISSGLLIFFNKIKTDLSSFWILGASHDNINRSTKYFLHLMSFLSILIGVLAGLLFLYLFDHYAPEIMPDVFVDRKIPILITTKGLLISFFVPYLISFFFVRFALAQFKREHDFLSHVRSIS